jgi:hypothetical protein
MLFQLVGAEWWPIISSKSSELERRLHRGTVMSIGDYLVSSLFSWSCRGRSELQITVYLWTLRFFPVSPFHIEIRLLRGRTQQVQQLPLKLLIVR